MQQYGISYPDAYQLLYDTVIIALDAVQFEEEKVTSWGDFSKLAKVIDQLNSFPYFYPEIAAHCDGAQYDYEQLYGVVLYANEKISSGNRSVYDWTRLKQLKNIVQIQRISRKLVDL